jgi:hypothetical protein
VVGGTLLVEAHLSIERRVPGDPREQAAFSIEAGFVGGDYHRLRGVLKRKRGQREQSGEQKNPESAHTAI